MAESIRIAADLINRYPDRFLFGTDEVAPQNQEQYLRIYYQYQPLWRLLDENAREKVSRVSMSGSLMGPPQSKGMGECPGSGCLDILQWSA